MKVRCSQIGKIMTKPRVKSEVLSQTAKTYIKDIVLESKYGIQKEFTSKYTDKGNKVEEDAINLAMDVLNLGFIYKNEEHFSNDWITGTPDVNTDVLLDVKSSWDATTFPFFEEEIPTKDYFFQLQGYLWLTNKTEALLCYCLVNTPFEIVEDEVRREHWKQYAIDESQEIRDFVESKHKFDHIPKERRLKTFVVKRDDQLIEEIKAQIELCRDYYNKLMETI